MDKCPKCGALKTAAPGLFACGTVEAGHMEIGVIEGEACLRRQLAAANKRAGRLENALRYYANPVVWSESYDQAYDCAWASIELDKGNIARKALEEHDAL